ncbi:MAG TPA: DnaB-like helicase N-terminal domain-containing protein [Acidimicrobiales bacterium]|nr:DnaB-like helicase N-terminal domain-containing protein [Acidimicrobiales bacterium]
MSDDDDLLPQDIEAEGCLIGAMLLRSAAVDVAVDAFLSAEEFYSPVHALIYKAILANHAAGIESDAVTVAHQMRKDMSIEGIGGPSRLVDKMAQCPSPGNAAAYVDIVIEMAARRRVIAIARQVEADARNLARPLDDIESLLSGVTKPVLVDLKCVGGLEDGPAVAGDLVVDESGPAVPVDERAGDTGVLNASGW